MSLLDRNDKTRRIIIAPESTVGTDALTSSAIIIPALASTRVQATDVETVSNADALDGYAGEIADTCGATGMGAEVTCEIRDYGDDNAFPPWLLLLLACGWEATHATSPNRIILTPAAKNPTDWPGDTAGDRSPIALSVGEVLLADGVSDEIAKMSGAVGSAKLQLMPNGRMAVVATMSGLVVDSKLIDVDTADLSAYGARVSGEAVDPLVMRGFTTTLQYVDDAGTTALAVRDLRSLELDSAATVERAVGGADGYAPATAWHNSRMPVTMQFADLASLSEDVMAGYYSRRGFLALNVSKSLGGSRSLSIALPAIQYDATRDAQNGRRMLSIAGGAVRRQAGSSTAPATITWTY